MITHLIIIALLVGLGILFLTGKGAFLIAGYNTMPKQEKKKYDSIALCKFMGKLMFALAGCTLLWLLDELYPGFHLFMIGQIVFIALLIGALIYTNTGNRFKVDR